MEAAEKLCDDILLINQGEKVLYGSLQEIKKTYGSNTIQLEYSGDAKYLNTLSEIESLNAYENYSELHLKKNVTPTALLKKLVDKLEIHRFQTAESSLNDIFIEIVKGKKDA